MFEHVGLRNLTSYFAKIDELLVEDGIAMNHGITSTDPDSGEKPYGNGEFIEKFVFPRGELPHADDLRGYSCGMLDAIATDLMSVQSTLERQKKSKGMGPHDLQTTQAELYGSSRFAENFEVNQMMSEFLSSYQIRFRT